MEDSSDCLPISTSKSESEVKGKTDSSPEEPISIQTSEVEKEISGTSVEENAGKILPYLFTCPPTRLKLKMKLSEHQLKRFPLRRLKL